MTENTLPPLPVPDVPERFCDGIGQVNLTRSMIRIEILTPGERRGRADAPPEVGMRLIASAEGFLQVFETLDRVMRETGMIASGPLQTAGSAADPTFQPGPQSPNFPRSSRP